MLFTFGYGYVASLVGDASSWRVAGPRARSRRPGPAAAPSSTAFRRRRSARLRRARGVKAVAAENPRNATVADVGAGTFRWPAFYKPFTIRYLRALAGATMRLCVAYAVAERSDSGLICRG